MSASEAPVRKLTVYNNGFQLFERDAALYGTATVELFFTEREMKEVLRTLSIKEDGGTVTNISHKAMSLVEEDVSVLKISQNVECLEDLLNQLRGARVIVFTVASKIEGRVMSVQGLHRMDAESSDYLSVFTDEGELKNVEVTAITSIEFVDSSVRRDIGHWLSGRVRKLQCDLYKLSVFARGEKEHTVRIHYGVVGEPWVPSYTLDISNLNATRMRAYARIINTTEENWSNVKVALVAGAPRLGSSGPPADDEGFTITVKSDSRTIRVNVYAEDHVEDLKRKIQAKLGIPPASQTLMLAGKPMRAGSTMAESNVHADTKIMLVTSAGPSSSDSGGMAGRRFLVANTEAQSVFEVDFPVTVRKHEHGVLPFFEATLNVQEVLVYNEDTNPGCAMLSLLFQNTSGSILHNGTAVVVGGAEYRGEFQMEVMLPGDEALQPYCIDPLCDVATERVRRRKKPFRVVAENGVVSFERHDIFEKTYTITYKGSVARTLYLDHTFIDPTAWELFDTLDAEDVTDRYYRFKLELTPGEKRKVVIKERTVVFDSTNIDCLTQSILDDWIKEMKCPPRLEEALVDAVKMGEEIGRLQVDIYSKEADIREASATQENLRENIEALAGIQQREMYVRELSQAFNEEQKLKEEVKALNERKKALNPEHRKTCMAVQFMTLLEVEDSKPE